MNSSITTKKYAVDLITFYEPASWGVSNETELRALGSGDAVAIWERILGDLSASGMDGFEMTFPPADWTSAVRAYGSAAGFRAELVRRGLTLLSVFYSPDWTWNEGQILEDAENVFRFTKEAGADIVVVGPPFRKTLGSFPAEFASVEQATAFATTLNRLGHAAYQHGVRVALHTEAQSIVYTDRDVDLLMLLTDPDYVHLCPDAAHLTLGGADAAATLERHRDRVIISHWKDATGRLPREIPIDEQKFVEHEKFMCPIGEGQVDWSRWASAMEHTHAGDWVLLELDMIPDPVTEMRKARAFVDSILDQS